MRIVNWSIALISAAMAWVMLVMGITDGHSDRAGLSIGALTIAGVTAAAMTALFGAFKEAVDKLGETKADSGDDANTVWLESADTPKH